MSDTAPQTPNIYLVGFMATGKSAIGRKVAKLLDMRFVDSDYAIEQAFGMRIAEIFSHHSEAEFRAAERDFIENGPQNGCVIACGGGLIAQPGMHELLSKKGVIVCLFARPETILERVQRRAGKRPLLEGDNPQKKIEDLLTERHSVYMGSGPCVSTDGRSMTDIAKHVIRIYKRKCKA